MKSSARSRRHRNPHTHEEQSSQPVFSKKTDLPVQTKLTIGQPGDSFEKEADTVADSVVDKSSKTPAVQKKRISSIQRSTLMSPMEDEKLSTAEGRMEKDKLIQEMPQGPEKEPEEKVQTKQEEEDPLSPKLQRAEDEELKMQAQKEDEFKKQPEKEEEVQMKGESSSTASAHLSSRLKGAKGKGRPLPPKTRQHMETALGADFNGVNIHSDTEAVEMNKELHAQAFAHGKDIYFNAGKYNLDTTDGKRLLAHELTHVVQQGGPEVQPQKDKAGQKFSHSPGSKSPYKKINGHFNGRTFTLYGDGSELMEVPAQAGRSFIIPEGQYQFSAGRIAVFSFLDRLKLIIGNRGFQKIAEHLEGYKGNITISVKHEGPAEKSGRWKRLMGRIIYGNPEKQRK